MLDFFMLSENQISIYKKDGLVKSSTCLSDDKVKDLNNALDKYLDDHKDENTEFVSGLYEKDNNFLLPICKSSQQHVQYPLYNSILEIQWNGCTGPRFGMQVIIKHNPYFSISQCLSFVAPWLTKQRVKRQYFRFQIS